MSLHYMLQTIISSSCYTGLQPVVETTMTTITTTSSLC